MSCKKGAFIYIIRHTDLRDLTANIMSKVCMSIEIEPKPTPLSGEKLQVLAAVQCYEQTGKETSLQCVQMEHGTFLHLWCFQATVLWEESTKSFTRVWHN